MYSSRFRQTGPSGNFWRPPQFNNREMPPHPPQPPPPPSMPSQFMSSGGGGGGMYHSGPQSAMRQEGPMRQQGPMRHEGPPETSHKISKIQRQAIKKMAEKRPNDAQGLNTKRNKMDDCNDIAMAVVLRDYPCSGLTAEQSEELQIKLMTKILAEEAPPLFTKCVTQMGALTVNCATEDGRRWLMAAVRDIRVDGCEVRCGLASDLKVPTVTCVFTGSKAVKAFKHCEILKMIKKQNPNLNADVWNIMESQDVDGGKKSFVVRVDMDSYKELIKMDFTTHLGLGKTVFTRLPSDWELEKADA